MWTPDSFEFIVRHRPYRPSKVEADFSRGVFRGGFGAFVPGLVVGLLCWIQSGLAFIARRTRWLLNRR